MGITQPSMGKGEGELGELKINWLVIITLVMGVAPLSSAPPHVLLSGHVAVFCKYTELCITLASEQPDETQRIHGCSIQPSFFFFFQQNLIGLLSNFCRISRCIQCCCETSQDRTLLWW